RGRRQRRSARGPRSKGSRFRRAAVCRRMWWMPTTRPTPNKGGRCRMLGHLWNRALAHYRTETVRNDMGGLDEQRIRLGVIAARVPQPTALERVMARSQVGPQQGQAELAQPADRDPAEDVRRREELVDGSCGGGVLVAGRMVVEIRGVDSLRDRLRMMRSHVREGTEAAAREAGRMGEATMKGLAPVDTGRLRDSIRHEVQGSTVRFGPGDEIDYAVFVE